MSERRLPRLSLWFALASLATLALFGAGVHVGARHPDMGLARLVLRVFGAEAGVAAARKPQPGTHQLDKTWIIGEFAVAVVAPPGAELESFGRESLTMRFEQHPDPKWDFTAKLELSSDCEDECGDYEGFEQHILETIPTQRYKTLAAELPRVEWLQSPKRLRLHAYWWHLRGYDESGMGVVEQAIVTYIDPRARSFLQCKVSLNGSGLAYANALLAFCKSLDWQISTAAPEPMPSELGGLYPILGRTLVITTPPKRFEFVGYGADQALALAPREFGADSYVRIYDACFGPCYAPKLRDNVQANNDKFLAELRESKRAYTLEHPLEEIAQNRFRRRVRVGGTVYGEVWVLRPDVHRMIRCSFALEGMQRERGDEIEQFCLDTLAGF